MAEFVRFCMGAYLQDYGNIKNLTLHMEIHTVFNLRPASYLAYIHTQQIHTALPLASSTQEGNMELKGQ